MSSTTLSTTRAPAHARTRSKALRIPAGRPCGRHSAGSGSGARRPARSPPRPRLARGAFPSSARKENPGADSYAAARCQAGLSSDPGEFTFFFFLNKVLSGDPSLGHVCWEPGRWHALLSFTCVEWGMTWGVGGSLFSLR